MRVLRNELDLHLRRFVEGGNGLVLGRAGVGKTHSLHSLAATLEADSVPYLFVFVDELGDASEEDIKLALGYDSGTFLSQLEALLETDNTGVLIFDGFDAARNTSVRMRVVSILRNIVRTAPPGWSTIVSVRNYDAAKSPALLQLFPERNSRPSQGYTLSGVVARHFAIPELTEAEVRQAMGQIRGMSSLYGGSSQGFKALLHVPFNLWLVERILRSHPDPTGIGLLESEAQLLDVYWTTNIVQVLDGDDRLLVLERITAVMVQTRQLAVPKADTYRSATSEAWRALCSAEVLQETGPGRSRISFSHNILFDYAVSILAIGDGVRELELFLQEDRTRPLFLRPSLVLFFTRQWHNDRPLFWECFWQLAGASEIAIRLAGRLIPPYVMATEARDVDDLAPLLERYGDDDKVGSEALLRVLQALRFVNVPVLRPWLALSGRLAARPNRRFAGELAVFLSRTLAVMDEQGSGGLADIGSAARTLFNWAWERRQALHGDWYDAFAAYEVLPLVLDTCSSDPTATAAIVHHVLSLLGEENFNIRYFYGLADRVHRLAVCEPALIKTVYKTIMAHEERSIAPTHFGGIVLPLTSTRRQDFEACHYALAKGFPTFLRVAPEHAIAVALGVMNDFAIVNHVQRYLKPDRSVGDVAQRFSLFGLERIYIPDFSTSWSDVSSDEPGDMLDEVLSYLDEPRDDVVPDSVVRIVLAQCQAAITWSFLVQLGTRVPSRYASLVLEVVIARPVLLGEDTSSAAAEYIGKAYEYLSKDQRRQLEHAILALTSITDPDEVDDVDERHAARTRDRLLARIPVSLCETAGARERLTTLAATGQLDVNATYVPYRVTSRRYSKEEWLAESGVDVSKRGNAVALGMVERLEGFRTAWMNQPPDRKALDDVLPEMERAWSMVKGVSEKSHGRLTGQPTDEGMSGEPLGDMEGVDVGQVDEAIISSLWSSVAGAAHTLAKAEIGEPAYKLAREVLLAAARLPAAEPDAERSFTSPFWSVTPRTEAIQGLAHLAQQYGEDRIIAEAFVSFAGAHDPAERFLTAIHAVGIARSQPMMFWALLRERSEREDNPVVLTGVLGALGRVPPGSEDERDRVAHRVIERLLAVRGEKVPHDVERTVAEWIVHYGVVEEDAWAWQVAEPIVTQPEQYGELLHRLVFYAANVITPHSVGNAQSGKSVERAREWLVEVLEAFRRTVVTASAKRAGEDPMGGGDSSDDMVTRRVQLIYRAVDEVVARLYYNWRRTGIVDSGRAEEDGDADGKDSSMAVLYYQNIGPILDAVLAFSDHGGSSYMVAGTAHHLMELLNTALKCNPADVLHRAAVVAEAAVGSGYQFDSMAVREVVRLVESILTDYRDLLVIDGSLGDMLQLLDIFADVGWPEALRLIWRLDEAFR